MGKRSEQKGCIRYRGAKWVEGRLPGECHSWLQAGGEAIAKDLYHGGSVGEEIAALVRRNPWKWPRRPHLFFTDMHADTDAFIASLVASGGVKKTGPADGQFRLTKLGRKAVFVIGGDCFDKGPSSIRLLRLIRRLMKRCARVRLLAGNHDVRMMLGIRAADLSPNPRTEHFFIRMGPKVIPFLKEIWEQYLAGRRGLDGVPDLGECRRRLYPSERWFKEFPRYAGWVMPDAGIQREIKRLQVKLESFEENCAKAGLNLRMVYAAAKKWQELFLHPEGEFFWFFDRMELAYRQGSFLFIHAGLDDRIARIINEHGVKYLNREFHRQIADDIFDFYYGPLANTIRTKYREVDMPLTRHGVEDVQGKGIHVIVHGHQNLLGGQRIMLRKGIINFQCDATMNRATRKREGLKGPGAAATLFLPSKVVLGVSTDTPKVRIFDYRSFTSTTAQGDDTTGQGR